MQNLFVNKVNKFEDLENPHNFVAGISAEHLGNRSKLSDEEVKLFTETLEELLKLNYPTVGNLRAVLGHFEYFDLSKMGDAEYIKQFEAFGLERALGQEDIDLNEMPSYDMSEEKIEKLEALSDKLQAIAEA